MCPQGSIPRDLIPVIGELEHQSFLFLVRLPQIFRGIVVILRIDDGIRLGLGTEQKISVAVPDGVKAESGLFEQQPNGLKPAFFCIGQRDRLA